MMNDIEKPTKAPVSNGLMLKRESFVFYLVSRCYFIA